MVESRLGLGKDLKNPFTGESELRLIDAYFLGAMLTGIQETTKDSSPRQSFAKWMFSIRLNPWHAGYRAALDDQRNLILTFLKSAGITNKGDLEYGKQGNRGGAPGYQFNLALRVKLTRTALYRLCEKIARSRNELFAGALLVGAYDCKGYFDKNRKYLAIDCPEPRQEQILKDCLSKYGVTDINYNPERYRGNAKPREPQLRIKFTQLGIFVREIGWTWEFKRILLENYFPQYGDIPHYGRIAQYILNACAIDCLSMPTDEDGPLLSTIEQDLGIIDAQLTAEATARDTPINKLANYEYKSLTSRQKRNTRIVKISLIRCGWRCEIGIAHGSKHETFPRWKDGKDYLEPHHLIPLKARSNFKSEIDCPANVVMLCSKCHDEIHYGENRETLISELYELRKQRLEDAGLLVMTDGNRLDENTLKKMY